MNVFFDMVGCRLNQAEIDLLALKHAADGNTVVQSASEADFIFVNTCCVTKKAAADSRKMIRKYQRETTAKVIAMGCWPSAMPDDVQEWLENDAIILNDEKFQLVDYPSIDLMAIDQKPQLGSRHRTRAFVKVQDGCRNQCSFCLTTIARGKSRSAHQHDIIDYVKKLEAFGTKEVVLTGVQLGSWGVDFEPKQHLADLIEALLTNTSIPRIRLSSIEPWDVSEALIEHFQNPRMCTHLHIPIQSGSDQILRAMHRPSDSNKLQKLFEMIHTKAPQVAITSDFLVGFPGETDEDFQNTFDAIEKFGVTGGHVFSFSPMPGTKAAEMDKQVQPVISKERNKKIREQLLIRERQHKEKRLLTADEVLFESKLRIDDKLYWSGLSKDMLRVIVPCNNDLRNQIHRVELESIDHKGRILGKLI